MDDLRKIEDQALVDLNTKLVNEASEIKQQIADAKSAAYGGEYSDRDWWRRVNGALNVKQKRIRNIQAEFKRRKDLRRLEAKNETPKLSPQRRKEFVVDNVTQSVLPDTLTEDELETYLNENSGQLVVLVPLHGDLIAVWLEYIEEDEGEEGS